MILVPVLMVLGVHDAFAWAASVGPVAFADSSSAAAESSFAGAQPDKASRSMVAVDQTAVLEAREKTAVAAEPSSGRASFVASFAPCEVVSAPPLQMGQVLCLVRIGHYIRSNSVSNQTKSDYPYPSVVSGGLAVTELAAAIEVGRPFATQLLALGLLVTVARIACAVEVTSTQVGLAAVWATESV